MPAVCRGGLFRIMNANTELGKLRKAMRQRRRIISSWRQRKAAERVAAHLNILPEYQAAETVTCYRSIEGELDTEVVIAAILGRTGQCYLPVIGKDWHMEFAKYTRGQSLQKNSWGLQQPGPYAQRVPPHRIDLALIPLVAFDSQGVRLGMGGGYYDRYFSFKLGRCKRPFLVGLAHEFQRVESLTPESWDVPLDAVITPRGVERFSRVQGA